mgnify:CR=1 FL=1
MAPGDGKSATSAQLNENVSRDAVLYASIPNVSASLAAIELLRHGVTCFIDLTEPDEMPSYEALLREHHRGGQSFIVLQSTAKGGELSRIVPQLSPGAGVVTCRAGNL